MISILYISIHMWYIVVLYTKPSTMMNPAVSEQQQQQQQASTRSTGQETKSVRRESRKPTSCSLCVNLGRLEWHGIQRRCPKNGGTHGYPKSSKLRPFWPQPTRSYDFGEPPL